MYISDQISLGKVQNLMEQFEIDQKRKDKQIVYKYKFRFTKNLPKRLKDILITGQNIQHKM
jgi:hypothetical protein